MTFIALLILAMIIVLAACQPRASVTVEAPIVELPANPGEPGVAYFTLRTDRLPMRLTAISSPQVARIELEEVSQIAGVARAGPVREANFGSGNMLVFEPEGRRAALRGIDPRVRAGGNVTLTFHFDQAAEVSVAVPVSRTIRAAPGESP